VVGTSDVFPEGGRLVARNCTVFDDSHSRIRYEFPPLRDAEAVGLVVAVVIGIVVVVAASVAAAVTIAATAAAAVTVTAVALEFSSAHM
jgi:hypothetical protein